MDFFFTLLQNNHGEVDIINMLKRFQWNPAYLSIAELSKKKNNNNTKLSRANIRKSSEACKLAESS